MTRRYTAPSKKSAFGTRNDPVEIHSNTSEEIIDLTVESDEDCASVVIVSEVRMPSTTSTTEQSQDSVPVTAYRKIYGKSGLADALRLSAKPSIFRETAASNVTSSRAPVSTASDIRDLAWSPLGSLIATADSRILRVWNSGRTDIRASTELKPPASELAAASKNSRTSARLHLTGTERVVWNPAKEAELASVGNDACLRFWDVRTRGQVTGSVKIDPESSGLSLAWRPERAGADEVVVLTKVRQQPATSDCFRSPANAFRTIAFTLSREDSFRASLPPNLASMSITPLL